MPYIDKSFLESADQFVEPRHDTDPRVKQNDPEYSLQYCKYAYGRCYNGMLESVQNNSTEIEILRSYAEGTQDPAIYMRQFFGGGNSNEASLSFERKGYTNINFEQIYSPMPKLIRKVVGGFIQQQYEVVATAVDERSSNERDFLKFQKIFKRKYGAQMQMTNQILGMPPPEEEYIPQSEKEMELYEKMGGFKLPYEIAIEKAIQHTFDYSNILEIKKKVVAELVTTNKAAVMDFVCKKSKKVKGKYIDHKDVVVEYSKENDFNNSRFVGYHDLLTIAEARIEMPNVSEDELRKWALGFTGQYGNAKEVGLEWNRSDETIAPYNDFRIPIFRLWWKSVDTLYKDRKYPIKKRLVKKGEVDSGKIIEDGDVYYKVKRESTDNLLKQIYKAVWVVGTEYVYDFGLMEDMPRPDTRSEPCFPIHLYRIQGQSIVQSARTQLDALNMAWLKLQNAWSKAAPAGFAIDISMLENINFGDGVVPSMEVLDAYWQTGILAYNSQKDHKPWLPGSNNNQGSPITPMPGGLQSAITDFTLTSQSVYNGLSELVGIDRVSMAGATPNGETGLGLTQLAMAATNDTLQPYFSAWLSLKDRLAKNSSTRIQLLIVRDGNRSPYYEVMSKALCDALKIAGNRMPIMFGIKIQSQPTEKMKQDILMAAQGALNVGKNGTPFITLSDFLMIESQLNSGGGMKYAMAFLNYKEQMAEIKAQKNSENNIKLQAEEKRKADEAAAMLLQQTKQIETQGRISEIEAKVKGEKELEMMKHGNILERMRVEGDIERSLGASGDQNVAGEV